MDAVVAGADGEVPVEDFNDADFVAFVVGGDEALGARVDEERAALDREAVLALKALLRGGDGHGAAPDLQIVLAHEAMAGLAGDEDRAVAAEAQVALGEHGRVCVVSVRLREVPGGREPVDAARGA